MGYNQTTSVISRQVNAATQTTDWLGRLRRRVQRGFILNQELIHNLNFIALHPVAVDTWSFLFDFVFVAAPHFLLPSFIILHFERCHYATL